MIELLYTAIYHATSCAKKGNEQRTYQDAFVHSDAFHSYILLCQFAHPFGAKSGGTAAWLLRATTLRWEVLERGRWINACKGKKEKEN